MLLWRLSTAQYARHFDGGYGLLFNGRWNSVGHAVTYCATSPSLCILEKLVHIEDPALLPDLVMVTYEILDGTEIRSVGFDDLPEDWRSRETWTQLYGDEWHDSRATPLLRMPSAIVPLERSPDMNVLINHSHRKATTIKIVVAKPFKLDTRLLR